MEVLLARDRGFCIGVKKAVELAQQVAREAKESGRGVWTLGPLIHNRRVVHALESLGVRTARSLSDVPPGDTLVLPSHGARPELIASAKEKGVAVRDATCPLVRKVQQAARSLREKGYEVVLVGQPAHTEVASVVGWAGGDVRVVENAAQARDLPPLDKVAVISQTTQRPEKVAEVVEALKARGDEVLVEPTLCHVTRDRQGETRRLSRGIDVLLVVGGRESANTQKLAEIGREMGRRVYHIEAAHEVDPAWFHPGDRVGITAGTSTPDWITEEVVARMKDIEPRVEAGKEPGVAAPPDASPEKPAEPDSGQMQAAAAAPAAVEKGARVTGTVVKVSETEALVDVGYKTEGVLPLGEAAKRRAAAAGETLKEGDTVAAVVTRIDEEGHPILSRRRLENEQAWKNLEETHVENRTIEVRVTAVVKGGLVADVGTRGFIPASQVGLQFIKDLSPFVGQTMKVKVVEIDRRDRRVILSAKKVLEEERGLARATLLESVQEGEVRTGEVKRVTDFGAFVDIGGVDGLLHVSEMSWKRGANPREIVKEGDQVEVRILKVDKERGRISLGLKRVEEDPWSKIAAQFPPGTVTEGRVVSVADFGAFVELAEGVEGLVHVSQLADKRVGHPSEVVKVGDKLRVKVLKVSPDERRISLSAREAQEEMDKRQIKKFLKAANESPVVTIGDMVGDVLINADLGGKKKKNARKKAQD